jgi:NADPH-dependent ferric siderophore reductase
MTASTAAFSLTPGIQVSLASHSSIDAPRARWAATARPGARQSVYGKGGRKWPIRPGAQERHDCVTTVFIIERRGAPAVHLPSMTGPSGGHRQ